MFPPLHLQKFLRSTFLIFPTSSLVSFVIQTNMVDLQPTQPLLGDQTFTAGTLQEVTDLSNCVKIVIDFTESGSASLINLVD